MEQQNKEKAKKGTVGARIEEQVEEYKQLYQDLKNNPITGVNVKMATLHDLLTNEFVASRVLEEIEKYIKEQETTLHLKSKTVGTDGVTYEEFEEKKNPIIKMRPVHHGLALRDGVHEQVGSDRYPYTVVSFGPSGNTLVAQADNAKRVDHNGLSESQSYEFTPNLLGATREARWNNKAQAWKWVGRKSYVGIGRSRYDDPSF